jgi:multidrug efflux pump subunit AcrA (membrane-fusion protein)
MNKQEALEAALTEARRYEEAAREVREWPEADIQNALLEAARDLDHLIAQRRSGARTTRSARAEAQYRERLKRLAGAALALMVTEVEIVDGRSLDTWLNDGGASADGPVVMNGGMVGRMPVVVHEIASPSGVSTALAREAYVKGLRDGEGRGRA